MRAMIIFFVALFAIPIVQVAIGPRLERGRAPVLIDRSNKIISAVGKRLWTRDIEDRLGPRRQQRPKAS
jgi:hypothetical protein